MAENSHPCKTVVPEVSDDLGPKKTFLAQDNWVSDASAHQGYIGPSQTAPETAPQGQKCKETAPQS